MTIIDLEEAKKHSRNCDAVVDNTANAGFGSDAINAIVINASIAHLTVLIAELQQEVLRLQGEKE